jgi:cytochrome c peroxidase
MKMSKWLNILGLCMFFFLGIIACTQLGKKNALANQVNLHYQQDIDDLILNIKDLRNSLSQQTNSGEVQKLFKKARLQYKKIEYLAEYYHPFTAKALNGPAIPEAEEADEKIIEPSGFQVIEEYLFPNYSKDNQAEVQREVNTLLANLQHLRQSVAQNELTDSHIFDALRLQMFRVITLGISGYDSPIALHSIPELQASLESIERVIDLYKADNQANNSSFNQINQLFAKAKLFLKNNPDFEDFNRIDFVADYANPLSDLLLNIQKDLKIPIFAERRPLATNAQNLFAKDVFNPDFYLSSADFKSNPDKIELGKMLFYDPILSGNGTRSCASCHQPEKAFSDGLTKSLSINNLTPISRNAPTILNAGLQSFQFYDLRVAFLEDQAKDVVSNVEEMHGNLNEALIKIKKQPEYQNLFKKAFVNPKEPINEPNLKNALAAYVRSLISLNSRFDRYMRGEKNTLNEEEKLGFNLFMGKGKCGTCHFMPLFNGTIPPNYMNSEAEIIGVPAKPDTINAQIDQDEGKYAIYHKELQKFAFKTPTVRNIEQTAPYMHNGVYQTLEQVVDFYNRGGGRGIGINLENQTLPEDKLNLTESEKKALIAFMKSLNDNPYTTHQPKKIALK